ncbi:antibiotic biosynthesis monooxygenase [Solwaraspora sp. WMMD406]|uniref:putative quinol monooxygenase n=1 Tax=Solwaraspora sp. WMMD406 TaxID=3016095 RepID=UPI0024168191|nr:antibiotic biosynthesis monooxygenase family protein [Solwaraspora sp. WMMD406]MDG4766476.1 antibiotic biosynthesis monooxygenase [Solwaraspora sp. WMMD406]
MTAGGAVPAGAAGSVVGAAPAGAAGSVADAGSTGSTVRAVLAMRIRHGCERRFETEWLSVAQAIRALDGCLHQDLVRDADDPQTYLIITDWADRDRLDAFGRSAQRDRLLRVIRDLRESARRHTYQVLHSVPSDLEEPR